MYDFLFICSANVGRSQMAEGFYNSYSGGKNSISAAGIENVGKEYEFRPHPSIIKIMSEKVIDISQHSVQMITPEMVAEARRIVLFFGKEDSPPQLDEYLKNSILNYFPIPDLGAGNVSKDNSKELRKKFRPIRDKIEAVVLRLLGRTPIIEEALKRNRTISTCSSIDTIILDQWKVDKSSDQWRFIYGGIISPNVRTTVRLVQFTKRPVGKTQSFQLKE